MLEALVINVLILQIKQKNKHFLDIIKQGYEEPNEDEIDEILNSLKLEGKEKGFGMKELCIFVEFITRYYEHINKQTNIGFLLTNNKLC